MQAERLRILDPCGIYLACHSHYGEQKMNEREAYIALNAMEKVGPVGVRSLSTQLGSVLAIFEADKQALMTAKGIGPEVADAIIRQRETVDWQGEIERAAALGAHLVTQIDEEYPKQLLEIHDPPLALYVWGQIEQRDKHAIAVVGTRRPTHYGRETAGVLASQLSKTGFVVVSGLAQGIDTAAHEAALKAGGRTLAVLGSGLEHIYPPSSMDLAKRISEHGAVITEFPVGRQPDKTTFPMRNRIVSGLSLGVLVVEAGRGSGALITANQALEQGRSVFAVPGRIDSHASAGTNDLIKNGARLVVDVEDVLADFEFLIPPGPRQSVAEKSVPLPQLSNEEVRLTQLLGDGECDVDRLIRDSGFKPAVVSSLLIGLEMKRMVRMLPGRVVEMAR
jgi:DNA processing protein